MRRHRLHRSGGSRAAEARIANSAIGDCLDLIVYGQPCDAVIVGLTPDWVTLETMQRPRREPPVAPGWLLTAIAEARGTHDCPVCNAGRPIPDTVTCPLCAGWTTI